YRVVNLSTGTLTMTSSGGNSIGTVASNSSAQLTTQATTGAGASVWDMQTTTSGTSVLTTKGDLLAFGTSVARVPVGADAQVLTADSTQPLGVKWAAVGGGVSVVESNDTGTTISADDTWTTLCELTLSAGNWLLNACSAAQAALTA